MNTMVSRNKETSQPFIKNRVWIQKMMKPNDLTDDDVLAGLRMNDNMDSPTKIKTAFMKRNGHFSIVK